MKKLLSVLLVVLMCFLCACAKPTATPPATNEAAPADTGAAAEPAPEAPAKKIKIGYVTSDPSDGFWKEVLESFQAACEEKGVEMTYQIVKDSAGMRSSFDSLRAQGIDILVDGYSIEEVAASFAEESVELGLPFMGVAFNCPVEGVYSYGTSNKSMGDMFGRAAYEWINKQWGGEVDLIVLASAFTLVPAMDPRVTQTVDTLKELGMNLDNVEVVQLDMETDVTSVNKKTMDIITSHPNAQKILYIAATDNFIPFAMSAIEQANAQDRFMIFSSDNGERAKEYFKETAALGSQAGRPWIGSLDLQTATYGYKMLDKVLAILNGETVEPYTEHVPTMITAENVNEFYPD